MRPPCSTRGPAGSKAWLFWLERNQLCNHQQEVRQEHAIQYTRPCWGEVNMCCEPAGWRAYTHAHRDTSGQSIKQATLHSTQCAAIRINVHANLPRGRAAAAPGAPQSPTRELRHLLTLSPQTCGVRREVGRHT